MTLDRLEKVNIKSLVLEEPAKRLELPFDPDRDIPDIIWGGMFQALSDFRNLRQWERFLDLANNITILDPRRINQLNITDQESNGIVRTLREYIDLGGMQYDAPFFNSLTILERLYGKTYQAVDKELGSEWFSKWDSLGIDIMDNRNLALSDYDNITQFEFLIAAGRIAKIHAPENFEDPVRGLRDHFDEDTWELIRFQVKFAKEEERYFDYAHYSASARILYPDKFGSIKPDNKTWGSLQDTLLLSSSSIGARSAQLATWMKILAAEVVQTTDDEGLKVIMVKSKGIGFAQPSPTMPEIRKF